MVPNHSLVQNNSENSCLYKSGERFLAYVLNDASITLNLSSASGTLYYKTYIPSTGVYSNESTVEGGAVRTFNKPSGADDWVVYVYPGVGATPTATPSGSGAFIESGGQVVMEAEDYDNNITRSSRTWTLTTTVGGYSGSGYMQALPDSGTNINTGYSTTSPEMNYLVNFSTTGTYYVWVRACGPDNNGDSLSDRKSDLRPSANAGRVIGKVISGRRQTPDANCAKTWSDGAFLPFATW
jgi:hypothetical protein